MSDLAKSDRGYAAVWIVTVIALMAILVGSGELAVHTRPKEPAMLWTFAIGLAVAVAGLVIEARRDLRDVCIFTVVFSLIGVLFFGTAAYVHWPPDALVAVMLVASETALVASVAYIVWHTARRLALSSQARRSRRSSDQREVT
jgi:hypothetical protein